MYMIHNCMKLGCMPLPYSQIAVYWHVCPDPYDIYNEDFKKINERY